MKNLVMEEEEAHYLSFDRDDDQHNNGGSGRRKPRMKNYSIGPNEGMGILGNVYNAPGSGQSKGFLEEEGKEDIGYDSFIRPM